MSVHKEEELTQRDVTMSELYAFSVTSVQDKVIEVDAFQVHPDAGGFAPTKNFALQILYTPIHDWTDVCKDGQGGPLDNDFSQDDFYKDDYIRLVCHDYIEKVEITNREGDSAHYIITLTDPMWGQHLAPGMSWDSACYNRGRDLPRPKKKKKEVFGPRKRIVRWPEKGLRNIDEDVFENATNLKLLDLSKNHLQALPHSFGNMSKLEELNLRDNVLRTLPESFGDLQALKRLELRGNQFESLPDSFGQLTALEELYLAEYDPLPEQLPESFSALTNLRILTMRGSGLNRLPKAFRRLQALEILHTRLEYEYGLEGFYEICHIPSLRILEIGNATTIPREIGHLINLETLILSSSSLKKLPETFGKLTKLKELDLYNNQLRQFHECLRPLAPNLQKLNLNSNEIPSLPEWIGEYTQLKEFLFERNHITSIPESIGQLTQLERLNLSCSPITDIPESIGQLTQLKELNLNQCQITRLPESIKQLTQLERLHLYDNPLTSDIQSFRDALPNTNIWL
ncbi:MAG: hypothetical protein CL920_20890 [Deltaproteobacteria bacterium]|nr:hypothetical protein [Deltaproteobacteria bacterium]